MNSSLFIFLIGISVSLAAIEVRVENAVALVGEDAVVKCIYTADTDSTAMITWYKTNNGSQRLYQYVKDDDENTYQDAKVTRKLSQQDGNLVIPDVTLKDNQEFSKLRCEVDLGAAGSKSADGTLLIAQLPEGEAQMAINAYDSGENAFNLGTGKLAVGSCTSRYGYPPADIEFYRDGSTFAIKSGNDVLDGFLEPVRTNPGPDGILTSTTKDLVKVLDENDHQAKFTCSVITRYGDKVDVQNFTMPSFNVNFDTNKAEFKPSQEFTFAGETMTLTCDANGFPNPEIYIDGREVSSIEIDITEDLNGKTYTCIASNGGDDVKATYTLNVLSLSEPVVMGEKQIMMTGTSVLNCSATGSPEPEVVWYKGDSKVSESGLLTFTDPAFEQSGEYRCQASNGHDSQKQSTIVQIDVIGLKREDQEEIVKVSGKKDEEVTLECVVTSNPEAEFTWSDSDAIPLLSHSDYTYQSTITVGPLTPELSEKEYVCKVTNAAGGMVETKFILPEIKKNSTSDSFKVIEASSSPVAGIIIGILVAFLVIGIIIAVLYNKGIICKKQEKGEESAEGDIAVEINNEEGDIEHGNAKPDENVASPEEEKLMNGDGANE